MNPYYSFLVQRENSDKERANRLRLKTEKKLRTAIESLTKNYREIQKIILFGSLAEGRFNVNSDIDLFIQGVPAEKYFEVKRSLEDLIGADVDLYTERDCTELIKKIRQRGVVIFERKA